MHSAFLDTDVILDLFIRREPHHGDALRLFSLLRRSKTPCVTSPVVIANVYYLLAKIRSKRYALQRLGRLRRLLEVATLDQSVVDAAIAAPHRDFEDGLQYQCAIRNDLRVLITRNVRDFPKDQMMIVSPRDYLDMAAESAADT